MKKIELTEGEKAVLLSLQTNGGMLKIGDISGNNNITGVAGSYNSFENNTVSLTLPESGYQKIISPNGRIEILKDRPEGNSSSGVEGRIALEQEIAALKQELEISKARLEEKDITIERLIKSGR